MSGTDREVNNMYEKRFYLIFPNFDDDCDHVFFNLYNGEKWCAGSNIETGLDKTSFTTSEIAELQEKFSEINFDKLERMMVAE